MMTVTDKRTTKTVTAFLVALLALGLVALASITLLKRPAPVSNTGLTGALATQTARTSSQAIITPQSTTGVPGNQQTPQSPQPPQPTSATTAVAPGNPPQTDITATITTLLGQITPQEGKEPGEYFITPGSVSTPQAPGDSKQGDATPVAPDPSPTAAPLLPAEQTAIPSTATSPVSPGGQSGPGATSVPASPGLGGPSVPSVPDATAPAGGAGGSARGAIVDTPKPTVRSQGPPTPTVVTVKATPKPKPGVVVLPNGVVYGDRKPNLPNRIVRIASPNIKLDTPAYEVYAPKGTWEVADYAAGHHYNSKNPGEGGNIVVAGHNNWRGEVFRHLIDLKAGDLIKVWTLDGKEHRYKVESVSKVLEAGVSYAQRVKNGKVMDPTPSEQLTLITCWPYTTFTHRVIVVAKPAP